MTAPRSTAKDDVDVTRLSELEADEGGRWQITRSAGHMTRGHGYIKSLSSAEVVSEPGLTWGHFDQGRWQSAKITVTIPKKRATIFSKKTEDDSPRASSSPRKTFGTLLAVCVKQSPRTYMYLILTLFLPSFFCSGWHMDRD